MSLASARAGLVAALDTLDGLRVEQHPPAGINDFPVAVVYPYEGEIAVVSGGLGRSIHTLQAIIYHARRNLPKEVAAVEGWPDLVLGVLYDDPTLGGAVDTVVWPMRYRVGMVRYGADEYLGVTFDIPVKIMEGLI